MFCRSDTTVTHLRVLGPKLLVGLLIFPGLSALADTSIWPQIRPAIPQDPAIETKIDKLLAQMSIEQKVGQMIQAEIKSISPDEVGKYHIGSVLNGGGSWPIKEKPDGPLAGWLNLANLFYQASMDTDNDKLAIPVIWGTDAVHGHNNVVGATIFPHNIGLGAANNPALMRDIGTATAREVAVTGIDWTFAPSVAVAQDVRWGRNYESYSEDPKIVAELSKELILGLQGHPVLDNFLSQQKIIATAKHFVGDGGTTIGTGVKGGLHQGDTFIERPGLDQGDTVLAEEELFKIHGSPYIDAIGVGVQAIMVSFSSWNGKKMHEHKYLLTDVLKNRMGFDGLVVGDWNGHEQIPGCSKESCPQAINAGVDLIMVPEDWLAFHKNTVQQVKNEEIPITRIDDAVRRILRVKFRAGMFDDGKPSRHRMAGKAIFIGHADHRAVARQAVRESLVLLKNDGVLPIEAAATIMVGGSGADNLAMQSGGWTVTWQGRDTQVSYYKGATSISEGFEQAVKKTGQVVHGADGGTDDNPPDVAVIVFGEQPYAEFEGDLESTDFDLETNADFKLMQELKQKNIPIVAVFVTGRPRGIDAVIDLADAFVVAWLPGSEGAGIADVLIADQQNKARYDFKGRLPFSWPKTGATAPAIAEPQYKPGFGLTY